MSHHPHQAINFDRTDPFFNHGGTFNQSKYDLHTSINQNVLSEGERFLGVPYGWAGHTFGGKQSKKDTFYTNSNKGRNPEVTVPGSSMRGINGYGIDCSGFITEVAKRVAARQFTEDIGTSTLYSSNGYSKTIEPENVRPGDFIVWLGFGGGHVVYVKDGMDVIQDPRTLGWKLRSVRSLEADPDRNKIGGRVKIRSRSTSSWDADGFVFALKRWVR